MSKQESKLEGNTINADINRMRIKMTDGSTGNDGIISNLVDAVKALLSTENIKQKSRKSMAQIWVSSEIRTFNKNSLELFGVYNNVSEQFNNNIEEELISLGGQGRLEVIEMVKNLQDRALDENKIKLANKGMILK